MGGALFLLVIEPLGFGQAPAAIIPDGGVYLQGTVLGVTLSVTALGIYLQPQPLGVTLPSD